MWTGLFGGNHFDWIYIYGKEYDKMVHAIFLIALFCTFPDLNKKYPFWIFTFGILFIFLALRYDYGNDYMSYYNIHTAINAGLSTWGAGDAIFRNLNLLIPNFYLFIAVTSMFYIISICYLIKKNLQVKQYWFAVLLLLINPYLFLVHLSSLKQTLAICFFIFAVNFAVKRKLIMYILFILFAIGMHPSAIILLPLYFLLTERAFNKKWILMTYAILVVLLVTPLFNIITYKILEYLPRHYYTVYIQQGLQNSIRSTLISSFFFFLIIFNINKLKGKEIVYGKLSLIASAISLLAIKLSMITRIGMYFDIFLIITIPQVFEKIEKRINRQLLFFIMIFIYILRYYSFFTNPLWESYVNYRTILGR